MRWHRKVKIRNKVDDDAKNPGRKSRKKPGGTLIQRDCCTVQWRGVWKSEYRAYKQKTFWKIFQAAYRPSAAHIEQWVKKSWTWGAGREGLKQHFSTSMLLAKYKGQVFTTKDAEDPWLSPCPLTTRNTHNLDSMTTNLFPNGTCV